MAKKDFLDNIDTVTEGADMKSASSNKKTFIENSDAPKMKMKNLKIQEDWDKRIKAYVGNSTGYMVNAIKNQMVKDGIL